MSTAKSRPIVYAYPRLSERLGRAIEAALLGRQSPAVALRNAQAKLRN